MKIVRNLTFIVCGVGVAVALYYVLRNVTGLALPFMLIGLVVAMNFYRKFMTRRQREARRANEVLRPSERKKEPPGPPEVLTYEEGSRREELVLAYQKSVKDGLSKYIKD